MARKNRNAKQGGNAHTRGGGAWMHPKKGRKAKGGSPRPDAAPLTSGQMHSKTRVR